ncbi:MAG: lipoate--protein ligase [Bdellovibrionaceae bacterium]|nr:lipoate--protein ligase [Pseudobdellovibrionaceae bacterium]
MEKLKIFLSESLNPYLNIGTEEWLFDHLDPDQQVLFLWRNESTVVIGRNQNPWSECHLARMKEEGVHLARRRSGGGAVFHDLGNTCFTFLSPKESYSRANNVRILLDGLKTLGVEGEASGRNDLLIPFADGPRKFSGSAYREKKDRAFHHGTLLLNTDLSRLSHYLTPSPKKLQAKGKESVRARVVNLNEINPAISHERIVTALSRSFESFYGARAEITPLSLESLNGIPRLKAIYEELQSWEWLYGHTLEFTHEMDEYLSMGFFHFQFRVEEALIKDMRIFTDSLHPPLIDELRELLLERPYTGASVRQALRRLRETHADLQTGLDELEAWLRRQIEV